MSTKEQEAIPNEEEMESTETSEAQEAPADNAEANETDTEATKKAEPSAEDQLLEAQDKYKRLYAEFENFRRRTAKERIELIKTAGEGVIKDLLPVLDDFERAIASNEKSEDLTAIKEGFGLLHQKFANLLTGKGLKEVEAYGKEFDLDLHEALTKIPAPSDDLKGKVVDVMEKGYYLNDKVIRYAKVVIGD
ncbi:MAG: nucleotide exchange factor GrpE [Salibacteraceae bacterium]